MVGLWLAETDEKTSAGIQDEMIVANYARSLQIFASHMNSQHVRTQSLMFVVACLRFIIWKSSDTWSSILRTLKGAVKVDGYFFATFFDASKIEKLVVENNKPWICRGGPSGEPVLSLMRDRSEENKGDVFGKKLIVFAETIGKHPEFLLDRDWLIKEMKSHGFELCDHNMRTGHFSDLYVVSLHFVQLKKINK